MMSCLLAAAAVATGLPLAYAPGTKVQYSNVGIDVGAAVVEQITGKRWETFLKEETVKRLLAVSTRPDGFEGYSMGLVAPVEDGPDAWFGHGGAWRTATMVNYHQRRLNMYIVQQLGPNENPIKRAFEKAVDAFFTCKTENADAYTGRMN